MVVIGVPLAVLLSSPQLIGAMGIIFGVYAGAMMMANILDQTVFSDTPTKTEEIIISQ